MNRTKCNKKDKTTAANTRGRRTLNTNSENNLIALMPLLDTSKFCCLPSALLYTSCIISDYNEESSELVHSKNSIPDSISCIFSKYKSIQSFKFSIPNLSCLEKSKPWSLIFEKLKDNNLNILSYNSTLILFDQIPIDQFDNWRQFFNNLVTISESHDAKMAVVNNLKVKEKCDFIFSGEITEVVYDGFFMMAFHIVPDFSKNFEFKITETKSKIEKNHIFISGFPNLFQQYQLNQIAEDMKERNERKYNVVDFFRNNGISNISITSEFDLVHEFFKTKRNIKILKGEFLQTLSIINNNLTYKDFPTEKYKTRIYEVQSDNNSSEIIDKAITKNSDLKLVMMITGQKLDVIFSIESYTSSSKKKTYNAAYLASLIVEKKTVFGKVLRERNIEITTMFGKKHL